MRIVDTLKTPIHGISTLAPRNRAEGHAEVQVNLRSDPVQKLTRRPPLVFKKALMEGISESDTFKYHEYRQDGSLFSHVLNQTTGAVSSFKDNVLLPSTGSIASYVAGGDVIMRTIADTTYVLNKSVVARKGVATDTVIKVTHINILSALNYGEKLTLGIGTTADSPPTSVNYIVPDLGDPPLYDVADAARATGAVAIGLAAALNAVTWFNLAYEAIVLGSSIAIYSTNGGDALQWVTSYVVTGQGDRSARVFGEIISDVDGLPLYAVNGTVVTVRPNPVNSDGTYYLKAERIADSGVIGAGIYLEEVVWAETRAPLEINDIDSSTLPHTIKYNIDTNNYTVGETNWNDRRTGNDKSCPFPEFMDERIVDLGQFQNRIVFLAGGSVYMSETDEYTNWFKASAIKLLVTDPIGITSSAVDTEAIEHISSHNRDMMLIAPNGQFKIDGDVAITPQTVSMPKVSSYDCDTGVAPIPMGDSVILAIKQGNSGGLLNFTTKKQTEQEFGRNVSRHVVGLLTGSITRLVGSVNSDMVVAMSSESAANVVYVFEKYDEAGKVIQNSWSVWEFPEDIIIVDLVFNSNTLKLITKHNSKIVVYEVDLYSRVTLDTDEVFLDYLTTITSEDGITATLPAGYVLHANSIVVQGKNTNYPLFKVQYTEAAGVLTFSEQIANGVPCDVYVGVTSKARYIPTRPFRRDDTGLVLTHDRIRISRWGLYLVNTHEITARIHSEYVELDDQVFNGRIMGRVNNVIGEKRSYTGDVNFSYSQDAELAKIEFFTDGYLGMTIGAISWNGQFFKTSGGM